MAALVVLLAGAGCAAQQGTIGAVLAQKADGTLEVRDVPPGLAAANAGVTAGDDVLLIDGHDVRNMTPQQIHQALVGELGEPVKLTLIRAERVVRVTLSRTRARSQKVAAGASGSRE